VESHIVPCFRNRAVGAVVAPGPHGAVKARTTSSHGEWLPGHSRLRMASLMDTTAFFDGRRPL